MRRDEKNLCESYLDFIRRKPCCVCGKTPVDPDHLVATGQHRSKQNDFLAIPMCRVHHVERHKIGTTTFESQYEVNLWREATWLLIEFFTDSLREGVTIRSGKVLWQDR